MNKSGKARAFKFVYTIFTETTEEFLQSLECKYLIYSFELGETGRPHYDGYVVFSNPRSFKAVLSDFSRHGSVHLQQAKGDFQSNFNYTTKENRGYFEKGQRPLTPQYGGDMQREFWQQQWEYAKQGDLESIDPRVRFTHYNTINRIRQDYAAIPASLDTEDTYGLWLYGPPRTGKSHYARMNYPDAYIKDINKWWCNYKGEEYVIIDELAPKHREFMTDFLKKWVDKWTFTAEFKGGRKIIRPKLIIVTSNYSIEDCFFGASEVDIEAIKSRFRCIQFPLPKD